MNKETFVRYAELKNEIKRLENEIEVLQPIIMAEMGENEEVEVAGVGLFTIGKRRTWEFPENIKDIEGELKVMKKEAQQSGEAEYEENPYLTFRGKI